MKKQIILIFLTIVVALSPITASAKTEAFTDVNSSHWAYDSIHDMSIAGVIAGYPDGSFRPGALVSYGEFIKMAIASNSIGEELNGEDKLQHWAKPYYDAGINLGYYSSYDINEAALNQPIPRGHMAIIASSMIGIVDISDYGDYSALLAGITDVDSRTPNEHHIITAYANGILAGYPDKTFRPAEPLTRGEAVAVISRLRSRLEIQEIEISLPTEEKRPLVVIGSVLSSEPEGTLTLTIQDYGIDISRQQAELKSILSKHHPEEAEELYLALCEFAAKPAGPGRQGIRKQYFGEYPVLIERVATTVRIFIFPVGYTSRTWNTAPGEINEFFF